MRSVSTIASLSSPAREGASVVINGRRSEPLLETNLAEDFLSLFAPLGEEGGDAAAAAAAGMTDPP